MDIIDINKYSWNYKEEEIKNHLNSIDQFIKDAKDCLSFLDTGECSLKESQRDIEYNKRLFKYIK